VQPINGATEGVKMEIPRLEQLLTQEQVLLLTRLLREVLDDTGYGDVKIIIAEKRVVRLKAEKSY